MLNDVHDTNKICSKEKPRIEACHLSFDVVMSTRMNVMLTVVNLGSQWTDLHLIGQYFNGQLFKRKPH